MSKLKQTGITGAALVALVVLVIALVLASLALEAWLIMLILGALFPAWGIGYGTAWIITLGLNLVAGIFNKARS